MASLTPERMSGGFVGRDPFGTFEAMQHLTDPLLDAGLLPEFAVVFDPAASLCERDGAYQLEFSVPGFGKDDITVDVGADRVTIAGTSRLDLRHGAFETTIVLPRTIDPGLVTAQLENGLLTIVVRLAQGPAA